MIRLKSLQRRVPVFVNRAPPASAAIDRDAYRREESGFGSVSRTAVDFRRAGRGSHGAVHGDLHRPPVQSHHQSAFYQRRRAAGKPAKVALTACMRKLLTLLNTMLKATPPGSLLRSAGPDVFNTVAPWIRRCGAKSRGGLKRRFHYSDRTSIDGSFRRHCFGLQRDVLAGSQGRRRGFRCRQHPDRLATAMQMLHRDLVKQAAGALSLSKYAGHGCNAAAV